MAARALIVRLGALGDVVHALPVLAALKRLDPAMAIDWLVEQAHAPVLDLVDGLDQAIVVRARRPAPAHDRDADARRMRPSFGTGAGYARAVAFLRRRRYDLALDLQGLLKSAVWARLSGARRVIGFARDSLREPQAAWFYTETVAAPDAGHVIRKNLAVAEYLGADAAAPVMPLRVPDSPAMREAVEASVGPARFAVLNPGAAWPNKRWPADRFAALACRLRERHGLPSIVTWGPAERDLAACIVDGADGAAHLAPATSIADLAALLAGASLVVSGDTGPLHIAAAVGTPIVGLYGPTWPDRNGPWDPDDEVISQADVCQCHHKRRCQIGAPCIERIGVDDVDAAVVRRLEKGRRIS